MAEQKEILESIRDIVSGKDDDSEILELTDMLNEDGSVTPIAPKSPEKPKGNDVLSEIDSLLNDGPEAAEGEVPLEFEPKPEKFEIKEEFEPADIIAPRTENTQENQGNETMSDDLDTIISGDSAVKARSSISELTNHLKKDGKEANKIEPLAPFRNGDTVEDLVTEMLKPMMKDWLDKNLPKLVNDIVQKEIQKLIPRD
jgi:cell pole-organizing protein PopZ